MTATVIALSLCLFVADQAADVMIQHQSGGDVSDMQPREVVEVVRDTPVYELSLKQERIIDAFREEWFLKCVEEKEDHE